MRADARAANAPSVFRQCRIRLPSPRHFTPVETREGTEHHTAAIRIRSISRTGENHDSTQHDRAKQTLIHTTAPGAAEPEGRRNSAKQHQPDKDVISTASDFSIRYQPVRNANACGSASNFAPLRFSQIPPESGVFNSSRALPARIDHPAACFDDIACATGVPATTGRWMRIITTTTANPPHNNGVPTVASLFLPMQNLLTLLEWH